jgi:hypothetical protein
VQRWRHEICNRRSGAKMAALGNNLVVGSVVVVLLHREHGAVSRQRRKTRLHVQKAGHDHGEGADELDQALATQDLLETQSHNLTEANVVVHAVQEGRYTIMLDVFATI